MTQQEKIRRLTGSPLWMSKARAPAFAKAMSGPNIKVLLAIVEDRIYNQDQMIANRLAHLSPEERDEWIKNWQTPESNEGKT